MTIRIRLLVLLLWCAVLAVAGRAVAQDVQPVPDSTTPSGDGWTPRPLVGGASGTSFAAAPAVPPSSGGPGGAPSSPSVGAAASSLTVGVEAEQAADVPAATKVQRSIALQAGGALGVGFLAAQLLGLLFPHKSKAWKTARLPLVAGILGVGVAAGAASDVPVLSQVCGVVLAVGGTGGIASLAHRASGPRRKED